MAEEKKNGVVVKDDHKEFELMLNYQHQTLMVN